ncbi:MAG: hypothetical protein OZ929_01855 [Bryobacterales bacterium]|nr:hypothetical protein [Bryobacterales bacterium]
MGAAKIAKGAIRFGQWSAEMIREYGEEIRPYLGKIWMRAQHLYKEQEVAGGAGRPPAGTPAAVAAMPEGSPGQPKRTAAAVAERPAEGLIASPSYDVTRGKILEHVSEEVRGKLAGRLADFEARNPERRTATFDDVVSEARLLDPKIVADLDLKKLKAGQTLDPAVRFAARETLNVIEREIGARDKQLSGDTLDAAARERVLRQMVCRKSFGFFHPVFGRDFKQQAVAVPRGRDSSPYKTYRRGAPPLEGAVAVL